MDQEKREKLNRILMIVSPLHEEQLQAVKKFSLKLGSNIRGAGRNLKERINLLPKQYKIIVASGITFILVMGSVYAFSNANKAFNVLVNGKKIAVVKDQENTKILLNQVIDEKSKAVGQKVDITNKITYVKTKAKNYQLDSTFTLERNFIKSVNFVTNGTEIKVNGEVKVVLLNKKVAQNTIDELAKSYVSSYKSYKIEKVEYIDKVELVQKKINLKNIAKETDAVNLLKQGKQKVVTYTVADGESVWGIARKNDMYIKQIQEANPNLNVEKLKPGQVINLTKVEPQIKLRITAIASATEAIAFETKIERDSNLLFGQEKVKQNGETGSKDVTFNLVMNNSVVEDKKVVQETITKPATTRIVSKGNGVIVASRGNGGSGMLGWPVSGPIWSGYGPRGGRMHTGIDIGAGYGTPIGAAGEGRVTMAGWYSGYGNFVIIDHGNGLVTRYGHLSRFNTSVGSYVSRGQIIGFVGATGDAQGAHLHFEVLINGGFQNPIGYLR